MTANWNAAGNQGFVGVDARMLQQKIHYFDRLLARTSTATFVPYVAFFDAKPHDCHCNAAKYASLHSDHEAVSGWLITPAPGIRMLHAHSVVRRIRMVP